MGGVSPSGTVQGVPRHARRRPVRAVPPPAPGGPATPQGSSAGTGQLAPGPSGGPRAALSVVARPTADAPARHATGRTAAGPLRARRFRAPVLAVAAVLGVALGAGTGAAVDRQAAVEQVVAQPVLVRSTEQPASRSRDVAAQVGPTVAAEPAPTATPEPPPDPNAVDAAGLTAADRAAGLLSLVVPQVASGELVVVPGSAAAPVAAAAIRSVRVEVEAGLDIDGAAFAATVMAILNDPRGWGGDGSVAFARTDGDADLRVVLASPGTIDDLCAPLETIGLYSCGRNGHAALNHMRWVEGTDEFADPTTYRQYLVNHEVGHLLGQRHVECPAAGALAPIMQQQTVGVAPCTPNGWPFPDAG